jgi:hypothetical protein
MFVDMAWLTQEAKSLHDIILGFFYPAVTAFLLIGVLLEYFKLPLGQMPSFGVLLGRAIVAILLMTSYSEVTNTLSEITDQLAQRLGSLNNIDHVLSKMGEKLDTLTASWVSVKETITMVISFVSFFVLYFSVYVAEGILLFTWTCLYVFSPALIALYVLPATAGATTALYRSLIEVSMWKVVWSCLATLLWSMALTKLNEPGSDVNFVSVVCLNLILAGSLLMTPWIVHALAGAGLSGYTRTVGSVAVGAMTLSPGRVVNSTKKILHISKAQNLSRNIYRRKSQPKEKSMSKSKESSF